MKEMKVLKISTCKRFYSKGDSEKSKNELRNNKDKATKNRLKFSDKKSKDD